MARGGRVRTVSVRVSAQISDFEKKMRTVSNKMKRTGKQMQQTGKMMTTFFTAPIVAGVAQAVRSTTQFADQLDKMSVRTGMTTDRLQELKFVTDQLGVSFDSIETTIASFTRRLNSADRESGAVADAFRALNVQTKDAQGQMRPLIDLYDETLGKLSRLENETQQTMIASQLFGRQYMEILPLLRAGGHEVDRLTERFRELGGGMSADQIRRFVDFKDRMSEISVTFRRVSADIATAFLPTIEKLLRIVETRVLPRLERMSERSKNWMVTITLLTAAIGPLILVLGKLTVATATATKSITAKIAAMKTATASTKAFTAALAGSAGLKVALGAVATALIAGPVAMSQYGRWQSKLRYETIQTTAKLKEQGQEIDDLNLKLARQAAMKQGPVISKKLERAQTELLRLENMLAKTSEARKQSALGASKTQQELELEKAVEIQRAAVNKYRKDFQDIFNVMLGDGSSVYNFSGKPTPKTTPVTQILDSITESASAGIAKIDTLTDRIRLFLSEYANLGKQLANTFGLFDRAQRQTAMTGARWLRNLQGQVKAMRDWEGARNQISRMENISDPLRQELLGLGPEYARQLTRLLSTTSTAQWQEISKLFGERGTIATTAAQQQMSGTVGQSATQIIFNITGNQIMSDRDIEPLTDKIVTKLKLAGVPI